MKTENRNKELTERETQQVTSGTISEKFYDSLSKFTGGKTGSDLSADEQKILERGGKNYPKDILDP